MIAIGADHGGYELKEKIINLKSGKVLTFPLLTILLLKHIDLF